MSRPDRDSHARSGCHATSSRCWRPPAQGLPPGDDGWAFEIKWDGVRAPRLRRRPAGCGSPPGAATDHTPRYPELAAIAAALRRARGDPRRRDRRLRRRRPAELSAPAAADGAHQPRRRSALRAAETPVDLRRLRPALARRPLAARRAVRAAPRAARRARASTGPTGRRPGTTSATARGCWEAVRERGPRGDRREAARQPLPARPAQPRVAQGPQPPRPGARDRRLDARRGRRAARRVGSLLVGHWDATPEEAESLGRPQRLVYAGGVGTGFTQEMLDRAHRAAGAAAAATTPVRARRGPGR